MNIPRIFLTNLILAPLALTAADNFADATVIEFFDANATLTETGTTVGATAETGEPNHAGVTANASFWYSFTVESARRVEIGGQPGAGADNIVMAVYTGTTLADLEVVSRYETLEINRPATSRSNDPNGEPFTQNARVNFDAVPGTTYFIAVDGENNSTGAFDLTFSTSRDPFNPVIEVVPAGANWSFYHALDGTNAFDPSIADTDFYETWHTAANYDGPAFNDPSPSPFSYGTIIAEPTAGTVWSPAPATGQRGAVNYLRTTFTPTRGVQALGFEGSFDDGAIVYINGVEVTRLNVNPGTAVFNTLARGAGFILPDGSTTPSEQGIQYATTSGLDLRAGVPVEIAVSVHNNSNSSSDSGFNMRVYATEVSPPGIVTELLSTQSGATFTLRWQGLDGITYEVQENVSSLIEATWVTVATTTPNSDRTINQPVFVGNDDVKFFRVRTVTSPLLAVPLTAPVE